MLFASAIAAWRTGLIARKEAWLRGEQARLVVVGNRAGDLDSIVSAMATAFLVNGVAAARMKRSELCLRRDVVAVLKHYGFNLESDGSIKELLFSDDQVSDQSSVELVLVDHNVIEAGMFSEASRVMGVIDHHADEGLYLNAPLFRVVDPACGSACTLVAERLGAQAPADLLGLLASTIAIDTRGFDPAKRRFSERDIAAIGTILDILGAPQTSDIRQRQVPNGIGNTVADVATTLLNARSDTADLTARQLLRVDYKQAMAGKLRVGAAGILATLPDLQRRVLSRDRATLGTLLRELADEYDLDFACALTQAHKDPQRGKVKACVYYARPGSLNAVVLEHKLQALPTGIPPHLAENPLFASQNITTSGFGLSFETLRDHSPSGDDDQDPLRFSLLAPQVTRKTFLPALLHFCEQGDVYQQ